MFSILLRRAFGASADSVLAQSRRAYTTDITGCYIKETVTLFPAAEINSEIKKLSDVGDDFIEDLLYSQKDKDGFDMIWRYFAWSNQTLAVFTLWALTVYLVISKKPYIVTLIPALFMTAVCSTYIFVAPEGLGMENGISQIIGFAITIVVLAFFLVWKKKTDNI